MKIIVEEVFGLGIFLGILIKKFVFEVLGKRGFGLWVKSKMVCTIVGC